MFVRASRETLKRRVFDAFGKYDGPLFSGRIVMLVLNLARVRPAASPGSPTRSVRGMSGFWIRQVESTMDLCFPGE